MTRHNLKEHLKWLVIPTPLQPQQLVYAPSSTEFANGLDSSFLEGSAPPLASPDPVSNSTQDPRAIGDVHERAPPEEFVRPSLPASVLNARVGDAMARLQSGPKSTHKPRLLSESIPLSLQPPTPSSTRSTGTSLTDRYNAQWEQRASGTPLYGTSIPSYSNAHRHPGSASIATKHPSNNRQSGTPTPAVLKSHSNRHVPKALDLTRDEPHTSSSSTVETFGDSRAIWREDSATRKEPVLTKGKKRTSDQFEEDELSARIPPRMSQSSFNDIDCFSDETSPPKPRVSPVKSEKRLRAKEASTDERRSPRLPAMDQIYDDDLNSSSTLGKYSGQLETQKLRLPASESGIKNEIILQGHQSDTRGIKAIADSEDEDDVAEFRDRLQDAKQEYYEPKRANLTAPVPTKAQSSQSPKRENTKDEGVPEFEAAVLNMRSIQFHPPGGGASPFQRDSPTKLPLLQHSSPTPQLANSSDPSHDGTLHADKAAVQAFLSFQSRRIPAILDGLHCARRDVAAAIYNCNLEGKRPADEWQLQPEAITAKINAIERLVSLREEYLGLSKIKDESKARVIAAISADLDEDLYAQDMKIKENATRRLSKIEAEISQLLIHAELADPNSLREANTNQKTSASDDNSLSERSTTLVKSTQATQQNLPPTISNPRSITSSGPPTTQYIQQTQALTDVPRTPKKHPYDVQTYTSSPSKRDRNTYFSPSKLTSRQAESMGPQEGKFHESHHRAGQLDASSKTDCFDDIEEDQDELFTTNMGTPFQPEHDDDEYGDANDYIDDFEAAAQEAENRNIGSSAHHGHGKRNVFAETSGNVMRLEGPKAAPAFAHAPPQHSQMQHPWSRDVKTALKERFHLRGFRPNQLEAINATLAGKDAFVLMPTGGGKSLCYQLPAIVNSGRTQGVTVVISPLLSLMQDQVEHLLKLQVQALLINSEVTAEHRRLVMGALKNPHPQRFCQLLYITPEMINKSQAMITAFRDLWQRQRLARIVIDEAHCVSQWGHDFRPDYKLLGEVRQQFRGVPVIALTATATENVKVDVIYNLGIQNCEVFTQSFNRPNLSYEVRSKTKVKDVLDSMANTINTSYRGQSGIIYCLSKKNCEATAGKLRDDYKINAHYYHAGMEPEKKKAVQKEWQAGEFPVIVATIAFGMGIDKPDVRFVIHHTIPKSLEGYYQETGRAGRDGKRSGCFMYYGYQDTSMIKRMIEDGEGSYEQKERQRQMLRNVIQFCENRSDCRRVQVLNYFNESFNREDCRGACDNCNSSSTFETQDFSNYAVAALSMVKKIEGANVTLLHCVDVFRGSKTKKITDMKHESLKEHGAGSEIDRGDVERLFYRLLSEDALSEHNVVNKAGFAQQYIHVSQCLACKNSWRLTLCRLARTAMISREADESSRFRLECHLQGKVRRR